MLEDASIALDRIRNGLAAKSLLMVGLRGVGKTVLLNRVCRDAEGRGFVTVLLEAPEDRSLPGLLCAPLHGALLKMSTSSAQCLWDSVTGVGSDQFFAPALLTQGANRRTLRPSAT